MSERGKHTHEDGLYCPECVRYGATIGAQEASRQVAAMLAAGRGEVVRDVAAWKRRYQATMATMYDLDALLARHASAAAGAPPEPSQVSSGAEVHPESARPSDGRTEPQRPSGGRRSLCGERLGFMRCQLKRGHDGQHEDWSGA